MELKLNSKIEALLFFKGEAMSIKELAKLLDVDAKIIEKELDELKENLLDRGIRLTRNEDEVQLTTSREMSNLIEQVRKDELSKDLGKAGAETLAIVLYKGPITRVEIDYIRGVNSTFILRNLLIRGLVKKNSNPKDSRSFLYKPTFELLSFLGITCIEELPEFDIVQNEFKNFISADQG